MTSLAARCTACGTVFRVVPDQLRVAGGLVRCGRCSEVFNAAESLIDLDAVAQTAAPAPEPAPAPAPPEPGTDFDLQILPPQPVVADEPERPEEPRALTEPREPETPDEPTPSAVVADIAPTQAARDPFHDDEARQDSAFAATALVEPEAASVDGEVRDADRSEQAEPADKPSFVRRAERAQRWQSPRARAALLVLVLLAVAGLGGQVAHTYRDLIAARWPETKPALLALCGALACRIDPPRSIDSLAVESSGLVRVEKSKVYKLQLALRNRAAMAVAVPALDLTLSDAQGKPIARRVLRAAELGVNTSTLAGGRELALQATLQAATDSVAGYTIELFYP